MTRTVRGTAAPGGDAELAALVRAVGCRPAWVTVGLVGLGSLVAAAVGPIPVPAWLRYLPLAASLLLFGLPHGAVDHLAPTRAAGRPTTPRSMAAVGLAYLLLGGAYAALWVVAPVASAALFVALTWLHWGQGDLYALDALGSSHLESAGVRAGTVVVRGGLPMLVPLLRYPERYRDVVDAWVALFGRDLGAAWLVAPDTRVALGLAFAGVTLATLAAGYRDTAGWRLDAAETLLLWAYFLVVPPLVAIGVYFCVWHSLRHVGRLMGVDDGARAAFRTRGVLAALARTGRDAAPLTAVSVVLLVGVGVVAGVDTDPRLLAALYLVFIAVLTLPHVAVVTWMDRVEGAGLGRKQ
ncbi:beta-carotene 15,15'-dioxygenase [Haloplanus rubicundus]|uniref:Probable beta-carotene 15,15'-dioxygenase n=1 Tax=Haloplanus rubicundus TaxID=1547898 RepID=A0A345E0U9_9EURY|nr:Brp/Blh family beta-carotene 15,15'-dioxygenase [Haloplanus rubicundus]AXG05821.1 beta-carotene 15,15'-dioxygenase [Haloplanus rubicundus]AXG09160.1 beta-carotene 15,15'-dioxygenase [Haloplanus rubicundus]